MKKVLAVLMAALLLMLTFAACSKDAGDKEDNTKGVEAGETNTAEDSTGAAEGSELAAVKAKGKLVVGITDFAPMDYKEDGSDEWTGFDAELGRAFAKELGVDIEFIEIDWDNKLFELKDKKVDALWNGMTITEEIKAATNVSQAYVLNKQVVVMAADKVDDYKTEEDLKNLKFSVEAGSAGESAAKDKGFNVTALGTQADALMEVKAGKADACIIDSTMATSMTGEGTDYANLKAGLVLTDEEYGVAFRQGSDLTELFNKFITDNKTSVVEPLAEKYKLVLAY